MLLRFSFEALVIALATKLVVVKAAAILELPSTQETVVAHLEIVLEDTVEFSIIAYSLLLGPSTWLISLIVKGCLHISHCRIAAVDHLIGSFPD